jgi:hypothetical protein
MPRRGTFLLLYQVYEWAKLTVLKYPVFTVASSCWKQESEQLWKNRCWRRVFKPRHFEKERAIPHENGRFFLHTNFLVSVVNNPVSNFTWKKMGFLSNGWCWDVGFSGLSRRFWTYQIRRWFWPLIWGFLIWFNRYKLQHTLSKISRWVVHLVLRNRTPCY